MKRSNNICYKTPNIISTFIILLNLIVYINAYIITNDHDETLYPAARHRKWRAKKRTINGCDLFKGKWVYDQSYPLYDVKSCPFVGTGFDCQKNGRPDKDYLKFRWQPLDCNIQRFDGKAFLERWRGKKIMFVGDSLSFNQWESLTCMLHSSVPNSPYSLLSRGSLSNFYFQEYGVSVLMLKNGFLVDVMSERVGRVLKLDSITTGDRWLGADILIFNSYHWWTHRWDWFQLGDKLIRNMDHMTAYKIALKTWADWVDSNIDSSKTHVFFQGISAAHLNGSEWREPRARFCYRQTRPVEGSMYPGGPNPEENVVRNTLKGMKKPVHLLDITLLSQLRKDGHPSVYAGGGPRLMDCSHWCLAGVPDTWNQLLYTILFGH